MRLLPWLPKRSLLVLGYPDIVRAADHVGELCGLGPDALEAFDGHVLENLKRKGKPTPGERLLPEGRAWLLVEFGSHDQKEANDKAEKAYARLIFDQEIAAIGMIPRCSFGRNRVLYRLRPASPISADRRKSS